jgi:hypothetical protein
MQPGLDIDHYQHRRVRRYECRVVVLPSNLLYQHCPSEGFPADLALIKSVDVHQACNIIDQLPNPSKSAPAFLSAPGPQMHLRLTAVEAVTVSQEVSSITLICIRSL